MTRKVGKSKMFQANTENPIIKGLSRLQIQIADYFISEDFGKKVIA